MSLAAVEEAIKKSEQYRNDVVELRSLEGLIELTEREKDQILINEPITEEMKIKLSTLSDTLERLKKQSESVNARLFV